MRIVLSSATFVALFCCSAALSAETFTINSAINQAVRTNPGVGEVSAIRRATDAELRQNQGVLLPQVRLEVRAGPEKLDRAITPAPFNNGTWQNGREASVVIRQQIFDGFATINQIWQQAARVDAAASRVLERTELIALDAAEAYIDVARYQRLIALAQDNLRAHGRLVENVRARFSGGRAGEGDLQQAIEREQAAQSILTDFRSRLEDARAAFRKTVGIEPYNLRFPGRLPGLPRSKDDSLAIALKYNPTIRAAQYDSKAAKHAFDATGGAFVPSVYLEGRALRGRDSITYDGQRDEVSGKVVVAWDIFTGGQDSWKRAGAAERMTEQSMRHARLQREAFQTLDKAWSARTITAERVASLTRELSAARRVVSAYTKEYDIGQRTLVDLLNAESQQFNIASSLVSAQGVVVFADYQLLAVMGQLLTYLKTPHPVEAALEPQPVGIFPLKFAPILLHAPETGPEPIRYTDLSRRLSGDAFAEAKESSFESRFLSIFATSAAPMVPSADIRDGDVPVTAAKATSTPKANTADQDMFSDKALSFAGSNLSAGTLGSDMLVNKPMRLMQVSEH
jgi:adhesin transport system outer membrane protein